MLTLTLALALALTLTLTPPDPDPTPAPKAAPGNHECKANTALIPTERTQPIALSTRHFTTWGKIGPQPV
jgi:hypothetical protein